MEEHKKGSKYYGGILYKKKALNVRLFLEVCMGNVFILLCNEASGHIISKLGLVLGVINVWLYYQLKLHISRRLLRQK